MVDDDDGFTHVYSAANQNTVDLDFLKTFLLFCNKKVAPI